MSLLFKKKIPCDFWIDLYIDFLSYYILSGIDGIL